MYDHLAEPKFPQAEKTSEGGGGDCSHAILVAPLIPPWRNSSSVFFVRHSALRSPLTPRLPSFAATKSPLYQCTETPASGSFARNIATMLVPRYTPPTAAPTTVQRLSTITSYFEARAPRKANYGSWPAQPWPNLTRGYNRAWAIDRDRCPRHTRAQFSGARCVTHSPYPALP